MHRATGMELIDGIYDTIKEDSAELPDSFGRGISPGIRGVLLFNENRVSAMRHVQQHCVPVSDVDLTESFFTVGTHKEYEVPLYAFGETETMPYATEMLSREVSRIFDGFGNPRVWKLYREGTGVEYALVISFDTRHYLLDRWSDGRMPTLDELEDRYESTRHQRMLRARYSLLVRAGAVSAVGMVCYGLIAFGDRYGASLQTVLPLLLVVLLLCTLLPAARRRYFQ